MRNPEPGEIYFLDPEEGSNDKDVPRPHVVLSLSSENSDVVTLAFGTSSELQAGLFHATHVVADSESALFGATGLSQTTYFYPSRLAACFRAEIRGYSGKLIDELPELRDVQLPRALGLGSGTTWTKGRALGSFRGRFARFTEGFAAEGGALFGLVVTEPSYSNHNQIQNVVPIFDNAEFDIPLPAFSVDAASWLGQLGGYRGASFGIQYVQGIFSEDDIAGYLDEPVDLHTMRRVEEGLASRLFGARLIDVVGSLDDER